MIKEKHVNKLGHSPMAAARKHAKFLRDHLGIDFIAANAEVIEILREARDKALEDWDHNRTQAYVMRNHTICYASVTESGQMVVQFAVPTSISVEALA